MGRGKAIWAREGVGLGGHEEVGGRVRAICVCGWWRGKGRRGGDSVCLSNTPTRWEKGGDGAG